MVLTEWLRRLGVRYRFNRVYRHRPGALVISEDRLEYGCYSIVGGAIVLKIRWGVRWQEITRIRGYKRDCLAVDLVCLAIECEDPQAFEVHEEMEGWQALEQALATHFDLRHEAWFPIIALPPFATNLTTLWQRERTVC